MLKLAHIFLTTILLLSPARIFAQEPTLEPRHIQDARFEGKILRVLEEKPIEIMGRTQTYQKFEVRATSGLHKGETLVIEHGNLPIINLPRYHAGDHVIVVETKDFEGNTLLYLNDYARRPIMERLLVLFAITVIVITGWRGVMSLAGMIVSLVVIVKLIIPPLLTGADPVRTTIMGALFIVPTTLFLAHGFHRKTFAALFGMIIALLITGVLTILFVHVANLTGFVAEEITYLQMYIPETLNIKGLLYAGILIGVLGVMDDVAVSQASIVEELSRANPALSFSELYRRSLSVGRDHIASIVNTLILVYAGASLPLLLLLVNNSYGIGDVMNFEIVAEEMVRTLVGSIGLVLAVPITTFVACFLVRPSRKVL